MGDGIAGGAGFAFGRATTGGTGGVGAIGSELFGGYGRWRQSGSQCPNFDTICFCDRSSSIQRRGRRYADFRRMRAFRLERGLFRLQAGEHLGMPTRGQCSEWRQVFQNSA